MITDNIEFDGGTYHSAFVMVFKGSDREQMVRTASVLLERELIRHMLLGDRLEYEASRLDRSIDCFIEEEEYELREDEFIDMVERMYFGKQTIN